MNLTTTIELAPPYLIFLGDIEDEIYAKTGYGLMQWRRELCLGQFRLPGCLIDLGLPELTPAEATERGAKSLVVGAANVGGFFPDSWLTALVDAASAGLDIVAGMHTRLADLHGLAEAAEAAGARLIDVRLPPSGLPVGTGRKRTGRRLLTVGTDCAVGKKYSVLALEREMLNRGMKVTYRATGQTGIMIAGSGIAIDAVVADFVSGAAEALSPDNEEDHWDLIEGQGAIFHPGYAGVTLGLLHGSQPDAIVLCHEAHRTTIDLWHGYQVPTITDCIETYLQLGRLTNADIRCVGVSVNTSKINTERREEYLCELAARLGLPCVDPLIDGVGSIVDVLQ